MKCDPAFERRIRIDTRDKEREREGEKKTQKAKSINNKREPISIEAIAAKEASHQLGGRGVKSRHVLKIYERKRPGGRQIMGRASSGKKTHAACRLEEEEWPFSIAVEAFDCEPNLQRPPWL